MDCNKVGKLILSLRKEKGMTQKEIADSMNISDKTISKWERGLGCPDVSLLSELSQILDVNIERILSGSIEPNETNAGNIKRIKFYVCPNCGNIINSTGETEISCCGRKLDPLKAKRADSVHRAKIETIDNEHYVTFNHEMSKSHYICFVAYVTCDRLNFVRLYPEQDAHLRLPRMFGGNLYFYCSKHGLWINN